MSDRPLRTDGIEGAPVHQAKRDERGDAGPSYIAPGGIFTPIRRGDTPVPPELTRATCWNDVDPADYAWNWKLKGVP